MDIEAQVLDVMRRLCLDGAARLSDKEIRRSFVEHFGEEYERHISNKWIGIIVRRNLELKSQKSHGVYVIPPAELPKLERLYEKYGLVSSDQVDVGDVGDGLAGQGIEQSKVQQGSNAALPLEVSAPDTPKEHSQSPQNPPTLERF